jgi:hypothetical protein
MSNDLNMIKYKMIFGFFVFDNNYDRAMIYEAWMAWKTAEGECCLSYGAFNTRLQD